MAEFRNNFSWSFTRHKTFQECRRLYYYTYYGYWGGWSDDAPDRARLAYRLKKMMNLPMWLGDLAHRMAERILGDLRNRELNSLENYQKQTRKLLNREWAQSIEKKWQWKPKYNVNLFEHYYGVEMTAEQRVEARDKIYRCLSHLMESEIFARLGRLRPEEWRSVEKLDQFVVGEQPVYVKVDCATACNGAMTIYDWKTGQETEETGIQLGCYALYAFQVWRAPLESQRLVCFYLDPNIVQEHTPTADELIETKDFILTSMEEMIAALDSTADENVACEGNFPMTAHRGRCHRCFFRELCFGTREWKAEFERG
ncbi:MAG TPA: PD-(D/E)XK nuclease family protein [Sumerlaeia bacterium]|nr:PD-(D/E)XK nuclease family protein [Sumerlaeia bacterium]